MLKLHIHTNYWIFFIMMVLAPKCNGCSSTINMNVHPLLSPGKNHVGSVAQNRTYRAQFEFSRNFNVGSEYRWENKKKKVQRVSRWTNVNECKLRKWLVSNFISLNLVFLVITLTYSTYFNWFKFNSIHLFNASNFISLNFGMSWCTT